MIETKADYVIVGDPDQPTFLLVYAAGTHMGRLTEVVFELRKAGIGAQAERPHRAVGPGALPVIHAGFYTNNRAVSVPPQQFFTNLERLKSIAKPRLPIAVDQVKFVLSYCHMCGAVSLKKEPLRFVAGFAPEDIDQFQANYDSELREILVANYLRRSAKAYASLVDAVQMILESLGARASLVTLQLVRDTAHC